MSTTGFDLVVVSNRLPVDMQQDASGAISWTRSPGGLVTALDPIMKGAEGAWVGWSGAPDFAPEPFDADGTFWFLFRSARARFSGITRVSLTTHYGLFTTM